MPARPCRRRLVLPAGLFALGLGLAAWLPLPWLTVSDGDTMRLAFPGQAGRGFSLGWTHSVELEAWEERFRLTGDGIHLVATRFKTFGAGTPEPAPGPLRLENGWLVRTGLDRPVDPLYVQAGHAAGYRLRVGGRVYELGEPARQPVLTFAREVTPLWRMLPVLLRTLLAA